MAGATGHGRHGVARRGPARRGRLGRSGQGPARSGRAWRGAAWYGKVLMTEKQKRPYRKNTVPRSNDREYCKEWRQRNPEKVRVYQRRRYRKNPERNLWRNARTRARLLGLPFSITERDVVIPLRCPIWGIEITLPDGKRKDTSASLDRIVPKLGYVPGNIHVISWRTSRMKNTWKPEEILALANWIRERE